MVLQLVDYRVIHAVPLYVLCLCLDEAWVKFELCADVVLYSPSKLKIERLCVKRFTGVVDRYDLAYEKSGVSRSKQDVHLEVDEEH